MELENISGRIACFRELLISVHNIYLTEFDKNFEIISGNYPNPEMLPLFLMSDEDIRVNPGCMDEMVGEEILNKRSGPLVFMNELGMTWMSDMVIINGRIERNYLLGPIFLDDYSLEKIQKEVSRLKPSVATKHRFMELISDFPVISLHRFFEYGIMLHCCITGERISHKDFIHPQLESQADEDEMLKERHGIFMVENEILKLVEEGNMEYEKEMERYITQGNIGKMAQGDAVRDGKNLVIIFTALCARAAIKGGISSEIAYHLRAHYIRTVERSETLGKVNEICQAMLGDFVRRVHKTKILSGELSPQIKAACDYICLHLNEKVEIHKLAGMQGYTDYYFSTKFKKETGENVHDYVNTKRIERAKDYLTDTNMGIQDICDELGYNSLSYFGKVFRQAVGMSPGEYRQIKYQNRK